MTGDWDTIRAQKLSHPEQMPDPQETEVLIIGAGPIGLFQAFQLGLLGIRCQIVESLDRPGGQCEELYADKPIYDIPGTAFTTASDFIQQLIQQIKPFEIPIQYGQTVQHLNQSESNFVASMEQGNTVTAKRVVLATGAGAFTPVKLRVTGIHDFEGRQVHYTEVDNASLTDKNVVVIGDDELAINTALGVCETADSVVFVHRKRRLEASDESIKTLQDAVAAGKLRMLKGKVVGFTADNKLQSISLRESAEVTTEIKVDQLLVRMGNSPKQSELNDWGIETAARQVPVNPAEFETAVSGIYAVGDINMYPAKRKLILCGFHEATLAAYAIAADLRPDKPLHLQYTTTSTELQQRLGVS